MIPKVTIIVFALGPYTAASINRRMIPGNDDQKSASRMMVISVLPPEKPEISPKMTPRVP